MAYPVRRFGPFWRWKIENSSQAGWALSLQSAKAAAKRRLETFREVI